MTGRIKMLPSVGSPSVQKVAAVVLPWVKEKYMESVTNTSKVIPFKADARSSISPIVERP